MLEILEVDGKYLGSDGRLVKDERWVNTKEDNSGTWYYVGANERTVTGWLKDGYSGDWYHYSEGEMTKGWQQDGDDWYHLNDDGKMATGRKYVDGSWYYLNYDGKVETNWQYINDNWYYLYPEGSMAWNTTVEGYYLNKDGAWVSKEVVDSNNDEINSLPEYDPLSARLKENKGTRAKKKGANGEYFAEKIDEFGNFIPDDIEAFSDDGYEGYKNAMYNHFKGRKKEDGVSDVDAYNIDYAPMKYKLR